MSEDNLTTVDTTEAPRLLVDSAKNDLESLSSQLHSASKDLMSAYKAYSRAKRRASAKASSRNLTRLAVAEDELGMTVNEYTVLKKQAQTSLAALVEVHGDYTGELYLSGDMSGAKKAARAMDSYTKKAELGIERIDDSVAGILSLYKLRIGTKEDKKVPQTAKDERPSGARPAPAAAIVHTSEVEVSPVSIDIGPTVERAVECAIAQLSESLEKRIAQTLETAELPVADSPDTALITEAAERIGSAAATLSGVIADIDKVVTEVGALAERCRTIVEMQRSTSREMQGIEVKQRLVNQEQTALIEAQEVVLQHQRLLAENQAKLNEAQATSVGAVNSIIESQRAIDASLKVSIKAQKTLLSNNSRYVERLNGQMERTEGAASEESNG